MSIVSKVLLWIWMTSMYGLIVYAGVPFNNNNQLNHSNLDSTNDSLIKEQQQNIIDSMVKRSWKNLQSSWGKRQTMVSMDMLKDSQQDDIIGSVEAIDSMENLLSYLNDIVNNDQYLHTKRAWKLMTNSGWGKRLGYGGAGDSGGDLMTVVGGKRREQPGWNNLKGLWGKRTNNWNKLQSAWGKRDNIPTSSTSDDAYYLSDPPY